MITRKTILSKTHYGLKIYSYILRQFYPEQTILYVNGNTCKPVINPFTPEQRHSLSIEIVNNQGVYKDIHDKECKGTVFDFAQLYFQMDTEDELLIKINDTLHLGLVNNIPDYQSNLQRINKALEEIPETQWNPKFSYFSTNLYHLYPSATVGILETYAMITATIREYKTKTLRGFSSERQQKEYKKNYFDYVTFSGTFTKRNNNALIEHSGLLTVDIDGIHDTSAYCLIREV